MELEAGCSLFLSDTSRVLRLPFTRELFLVPKTLGRGKDKVGKEVDVHDLEKSEQASQVRREVVYLSLGGQHWVEPGWDFGGRLGDTWVP